MDNLKDLSLLVDSIIWIKIICYGVIILIFLHKINVSVRYRVMNYFIIGMLLNSIFALVSFVFAPNLVNIFRILSLPLLIGAAWNGVYYYATIDYKMPPVKGNIVVKEYDGNNNVKLY